MSTASPNVTEPDDDDAHVFVGAGTRFDLNEFLGLRLDAHVSLVPIRGSSYGIEPEVWLSVTYRIGGKAKDSDEDGISDRDDKCRLDAEDRDGWQDEDGCPELDNDGDGLLDAADRCPDVAETKNGVRDDDGCPDADKDGDGIDDEHDKCPPVPENKNGFEDDDGCPDDPDSDGDGIPDSRDNCPKDKETRNNLDDEDGCPDQSPDSDGDGIEDTMDKCPRDAETKNGFADGDGCPDKVPDKLKKFMGALAISWEGTSAQLTTKAQAYLDGLAAALQVHADVKATLVGYAQDEKVGQGQAGAVRYYLMSKGVAAERLVATGSALGADAAKGKGPRVEIVYP
ncbi:MAG: thrombospondin type 3 repeat-containing protein [Deltaproteobacteria bacterium]|nr:thrombospondin type 3 repeat-containing protein [Deltaproteobacteria bacterium]